MKIGIDISQVVFSGTGVARYTENLVRTLLEKNQDEHFVLFGSSLRRQSQLIDFVNTLSHKGSYTTKISWLPPKILALLWNRLHVISIETFTGEVDVIHTSDWTEPPSMFPKVTTIHDLIVYKYPENLPQSIVENQKAKLAWVSKESRLILADSNSTKQDVVTYLHIPEEKIRVVYLGVDPIYFPQKIDSILAVKKKLGIQKKYILCVGTREPRKNLQRIVNAFENLKPNDCDLVVTGNPGWGTDIAKRKNIKITGFVHNQDLAALYSGAECFVYPSLYEGFGLPVLEAMACGTPVVTSNRGSLAEIVGDCAVIVDPESVEDIQRGIQMTFDLSSTERKIVVTKAKKHASQFTWKKTAEETMTIYKEVSKT